MGGDYGSTSPTPSGPYLSPLSCTHEGDIESPPVLREIGTLNIEVGGGSDVPASTQTTESLKVRDLDVKFQAVFLRKVYLVQLAELIVVVCMSIGLDHATKVTQFFFKITYEGIAFTVILGLFTVALLGLLWEYRKIYPVNWVLLVAFTLFVSFDIGVICNLPKGKIFLLHEILEIVSLIGLYIYSFWGSRKGLLFHFWLSFIVVSIPILATYVFFQIVIPFGKFGSTFYGFISAEIATALMIYSSPILVNTYEFTEYLWASWGILIDMISFYFGYEVNLNIMCRRWL